VFAKGPKYREAKSINWKHNFKILMDAVGDCTRQWAKHEKEFDILSEGIHKYFKVMLPVYGFSLTIFRSFGEHLS
jgi:hypothetical protein